MTEDEVEAVAVELAKAGGVGWYPGRERGPLKHVADRYRDRARLAIAALSRLRAGQQGADPADSIDISPSEPGSSKPSRSLSEHSIQVGSIVLYRPPGDRRAYPCRVNMVEGSRVHLMPDIKACTGWIDVAQLLSNGPEGTRHE
jgi:hypothetical protein